MIARAVRRLLPLVRDQRGVAAAEYAILAVGVVVVVGAALLVLLDPNQNAFVQLGSTVAETQASLISNPALNR